MNKTVVCRIEVSALTSTLDRLPRTRRTNTTGGESRDRLGRVHSTGCASAHRDEDMSVEDQSKGAEPIATRTRPTYSEDLLRDRFGWCQEGKGEDRCASQVNQAQTIESSEIRSSEACP